MIKPESKRWYHRFREQVRSRPIVDRTYRIAVGTVGAVALCVGIILIPYPGPGWLLVFGALAILGTEFHWARRMLRFVRRRYDTWSAWVFRQSHAVRLVLLFLTGTVTLVTLWLINAFGLTAEWLGLPWDWVRSPLV